MGTLCVVVWRHKILVLIFVGDVKHVLSNQKHSAKGQGYAASAAQKEVKYVGYAASVAPKSDESRFVRTPYCFSYKIRRVRRVRGLTSGEFVAQEYVGVRRVRAPKMPHISPNQLLKIVRK